MRKFLNFWFNNYSITLHKMIESDCKSSKDKFESFKKGLNFLDLTQTSNYKKNYKIEDI